MGELRGVLQRVAACCSVLQRVAACCSVLQRVAACCNSNKSLGCCSIRQWLWRTCVWCIDQMHTYIKNERLLHVCVIWRCAVSDGLRLTSPIWIYVVNTYLYAKMCVLDKHLCIMTCALMYVLYLYLVIWLWRVCTIIVQNIRYTYVQTYIFITPPCLAHTHIHTYIMLPNTHTRSHVTHISHVTHTSCVIFTRKGEQKREREINKETERETKRKREKEREQTPGAAISKRCSHPHTATLCSTLQHTATHRNTLQHTAKHCNTLHHTDMY